MIIAKVEGLTELRNLLQRRLPYEVQTKALQATLSKATQPIVKDARSRASVKTGTLRKAIYSFRSRKSTKEKAVRLISVRSGRKYGAKDAYYWRWVEFGRGVVTVGKKRGAARGGERAASLGNESAGWFGKEVKAIPARPFMRPAFEAQKYTAIETFRREMAGQIEKAAQKLVRKNFRKVFGL